jgi:hypothetical protein
MGRCYLSATFLDQEKMKEERRYQKAMHGLEPFVPSGVQS